MKCKKCGAELEDGSKFCTSCGAKVIVDDSKEVFQETMDDVQEVALETLKNASEITKKIVAKAGEGAKSIKQHIDNANAVRLENEKKAFESIEQAADDERERAGGIVLAENEIIVRRYLCAALKGSYFSTRDNVGYLTVTNHRILYEGSDGNSRIAMETPIDSVGSIKAYNGINMSLKSILIGCAIILFLMALNSWEEFRWIAGNSIIGLLDIAGLVVAVLFILSGLPRKAYSLSIYSGAVAGTAINIGEGAQGYRGNEAFYTMFAAPTPITEKMTHEIGAMIHDLQTMGDLAIEKWKEE